MRTTAGRAAALAASCAVLLAGCGASSTPPTGIGGHTSRTPKSQPTPTIAKPGKSCKAKLGVPVTFRLPKSPTVVRVAPKRVHVYTGRLASYASAYPPANGYFLKIPLTLAGLGPGTWQIDRLAFVIHAGGRTVDVNSGNGGFSGASHVLTSTFLDKGDVDKTNLVIDSPASHGVMSYEPKGKLACSWTF